MIWLGFPLDFATTVLLPLGFAFELQARANASANSAKQHNHLLPLFINLSLREQHAAFVESALCQYLSFLYEFGWLLI
jgi:hypothetical protein